MSGATAPAPTRAKPPASAKFDANGAGALGFVALERGRLEREQQALGLGRRVHELRRGMVAEVLADGRLLQHDLDLAHREVLGISDAGEHQQLRGVVGAGGEYHLALGVELLREPELRGFDADRTRALEEDPVSLHVGHHLEVRTLGGGVQICHGGRGPHPLALRHLVHPDAVLLAVVEVLVARQPGLDARLDEGMGDAVLRALLADGERPARAVERRRAALVVLGLDEVREQVGPAPAGDPPAVVVERVAADVDHRVDRGGAAEDAPARKRDAPAVAVLFRSRVVVPVDLGPAELQVAEGDVDVLVHVRRAGLQQEHLHVRVLAQARRQHAARGTRPDDHVVVHPKAPLSVAELFPRGDDTGRNAGRRPPAG